MNLNPNIPSLNIINRNLSDDALSNILSSLRGKDTISRDSINNIMAEPKLQKIFSNSVSENQEIQLYKELISSTEYQIINLKKILELKKNKLTENFNSNLKSLTSNNPQLENEKNKYYEKINNINKEHKFIENNLQNEYEYFKKKLQYKKDNMILKKDSQKICNELSLSLQKYSFKVLDKLIQLKGILNECSKYISFSSISQINTQYNYKTIKTCQSQIDYNKKKLFHNSK
jgi:hypothetical protein